MADFTTSSSNVRRANERRTGTQIKHEAQDPSNKFRAFYKSRGNQTYYSISILLRFIGNTPRKLTDLPRGQGVKFKLNYLVLLETSWRP